MAIEVSQAKETLNRLIKFFQLGAGRPNTPKKVYEAENPFETLGVYGKIPTPKEFGGILHSRLKINEVMALDNPRSRVKIYENEILTIYVNNSFQAKNGHNVNYVMSYYEPMYQGLYKIMEKTQDTECPQEVIAGINRSSKSFEVVLQNHEIEA
jgi:hypothetical protein